MKPIYRIGTATLLVAALGLRGCTMGTNSNSAYTSGQMQREQTVCFGTIDSVRNVMIDREQMGVGTVAGDAAGGIGPAVVIGRGNGPVVADVLSAILSGVAGSTLESQMNKRPGLEITVKLDNGEYRAIT